MNMFWTGGIPATKVAAGYDHTCISVSDGRVVCMGRNYYGQLGIVFTDSTFTSPFPLSVYSITDAEDIVAGQYHSCARLTGGSVKCWGYNAKGQLGIGNTTQQNSPVTITGLSGVADISLGGNHTCATLTDGNVKCWGANRYGQLGIGSYEPLSQLTPEFVYGFGGS